MGYIQEEMNRMNVDVIRSFILSGTENFSDQVHPYEQTLERESEPIYQRLEKLYPDAKELDKAMNDLSRALSAYENVYMEMGMKAGARLVAQLL